MTSKQLWVALCLATCSMLCARAEAQVFSKRTISFEKDCAGADTPNNFVLGYKQVASDLYAACGVSSITSGGSLGTQQLANGAINGKDGSVALAGALSTSGGLTFGDLVIIFSPAVNELSFEVLDLNNESGLTIKLQTVGGAVIPVTQPTVSSGIASFSKTSTILIEKVTLSYVPSFGIDGWFVDKLSFNAWRCDDKEVEPGAGEDCDDGNTVQCDTCGNTCKTTIDGCLDGATCVANGSTKPGSGSCAVCDLSKRVVGSDVGYTNKALNTACDDDGFACTANQCSADGECLHPVTTGCLVDGACRADQALNPQNACELCDANASTLSWTSVGLGGTCDDDLFCTTSDQCNGAGKCVGQTRDCSDKDVGNNPILCTVDSCDETQDRCAHAVAVGCLINGACVADGELRSTNPCEVCDRQQSSVAWTTKPSGARCGDPSCLGGVLTPAPVCNAGGTCASQPTQTCDGAICANEQSCTGTCQSDTDCLAQSHCERGECKPDGDNGSPCTRGAECTSAYCADGVCCNAACDRSCEACNLAGSVGTCTGHGVGTDPEKDCPDAQICSAPGVCVPEDRPDGTQCDRDAVCKSGHCVDGVCCDSGCDGTCEACNVGGRGGRCTPFDVGTDPANECSGEEVCNGSSMCVGYETRGNGLCTASPAPSARGGWAALALAGVVTLGRRRWRGGHRGIERRRTGRG